MFTKYTFAYILTVKDRCSPALHSSKQQKGNKIKAKSMH